jgi:hypothetical protein
VPENVGTSPKGCLENSVCTERRSESPNPRIESGLRSSLRLDLEQSIEIYGIVATAVGPDDEDVPSIGEQRPSLGDRDDDTRRAVTVTLSSFEACTKKVTTTPLRGDPRGAL